MAALLNCNFGVHNFKLTSKILHDYKKLANCQCHASVKLYLHCAPDPETDKDHVALKTLMLLVHKEDAPCETGRTICRSILHTNQVYYKSGLSIFDMCFL